MVSMNRKLLMLLIATIIVSNAEALHLGIYDQIYHQYVSGYEIDDLADRPVADRYQKWNGTEWVTRSTTAYEYDVDDQGRVTLFARQASDIDRRFVYHYAYEGGAISEVRWQVIAQNKGGEVIDSGRLEIGRSPTRIMESEYQNGDLKSETTYELDDLGRVIHVKLIQWNPLVNAMRTMFERSITYVSRDSDRIATIESVRTDDRPPLVLEFSYRGNVVTIASSDGQRDELEYQGGRLVRHTALTPDGQFARIAVYFDYDEAGRLLSRATFTSYEVEDALIEPRFEDIRIEYVYE